MKLFIREHKAFIALQFVQALIMMFILWFAGFQQISILVYTGFIQLFLACLYLIYYFVTRRRLYDKRVTESKHLSDTLTFLGYYPLPEHVQQLLRTQYKQYETEVVTLQSKQEEHLAYVDLWAHQMKTPLSVIKLMAQEIDEPLSSDLREEVERMKDGLDMMLHMARLRTVEQDFVAKKIRVKKLFETIIQEQRRLFIRNQIFPNIQLEDDTLEIYSDEKWLYFILEQFIHNAVKYSAGIGKYVTVAAERENGHTVLSVTDEGVGIPLADQKRIFEAFFTGENGRKFRRESTGVGLYIVAEICRYLGHELRVQSTEGKGTTLQIII